MLKSVTIVFHGLALASQGQCFRLSFDPFRPSDIDSFDIASSLFTTSSWVIGQASYVVLHFRCPLYNCPRILSKDSVIITNIKVTISVRRLCLLFPIAKE